jgi:serine/threonine protein kinase
MFQVSDRDYQPAVATGTAVRQEQPLVHSQQSMVGETLNHYHVLEKLGEGGMGHVYLAEDKRLNRRVALKVLPADMARESDQIERFEREARAVAALNHPNIVTIFSVEEAGGVRFLTMELVDGKSLDDLIPLGGLELDEFFELAVPLTSAAAAAHRKGIIHRDIKPPNVMVNSEGVVKLLDLGLARLRPIPDIDEPSVTEDQTLTRDGRILGTVPYMAPEQLSGKPIDHRVDIFSLGIVLYQMLTGVRPFQGDSQAEIISAILRDRPPPLLEVRPSLPAHLDRVLLKCLRKAPDDRFETAAQLRNELRALRRLHQRGELGVSLREDRDQARVRRRWTHVLLAAGLALSAAILAGTFFSFDPIEPRSASSARLVVAKTPRFASDPTTRPEPALVFPASPPVVEPRVPVREAPRQPGPVAPPPQAPAPIVIEQAPSEPIDRPLKLRLTSEISAGVISLYADDLRIYSRDFQFEERKHGFLGRVGMKRRVGGEITDDFTLPAGTDRLRVYVALAGEPARQFVFDPAAVSAGAEVAIGVSESAEIVAEIVAPPTRD